MASAATVFADFEYKHRTFCQSHSTLPQVPRLIEVQPTRYATFPEQLDYRSRADLILIDPTYHGRSEAAGARAHLRGKLSYCMCSHCIVYFTFCWGVAVPSVPTRQFSTWFLFPKARNSLKQALALMTDLQESLLTSQGPSDRADEMKTRMRLVWIRIVLSWVASRVT
jgi:hypothetical protein